MPGNIFWSLVGNGSDALSGPQYLFAPFVSTSLMTVHDLKYLPDHSQVALVINCVWHQSLDHIILPHFVYFTGIQFLLFLLFYCVRIYDFYFCILFYSVSSSHTSW
jgi:hypothetical protein